MLPLILLILLLAAPLSLWSAKVRHPLWGPLLLALPAALATALLAFLGPQVFANGPIAYSIAWVPQIGVDFTLQLSGLGWILGTLVCGIGTLIMCYAHGYMHGDPGAPRLYLFLYLFMLAMAGLALSDHMIVFFIFWELTSITSYLLIGYKHNDAEARSSALQALLVTGLGGMALLAGMLMLNGVTGSWNFSELSAHRDLIVASPLYPAILTLILLGAFTKSAQFPFHFWLPNAMTAPTPVSAYLHSATMVKAGVFLLFLVSPIIGGTTAWTVTLGIAGGLTLLIGGLFGMRECDLKKILAGTTLAVLGLLTFLIGIGGEQATKAALLFMIAHALYKAALFMCAGSVDHGTGTRDVRLLGGLHRALPWTAAAALMAAISKMGLPPMLGFVGKEYTYKAALAGGQWWVPTLLVVGNAFMVTLAIRVGILPFRGRDRSSDLPHSPHEATRSMLVGPLVLAGVGLLVGLFPALLSPVITAAQSAVHEAPVKPASIHLWSGFNLPLALSAVTLGLGLLLLKNADSIRYTLGAQRLPTAEGAYQRILNGVLAFANWQTRVLLSGYLRSYLLIILGTTAALVSYKLWRVRDFPIGDGPEAFSWTSILVTLMMFGGIAMAVTATKRINALIALGVVGFGTALLFALYSAPDLAITQILVETLTVVLFAWVTAQLPKMRSHSSRTTHVVDGIIATFFGILTTILVLKSEAVQMGQAISKQLTEWSYIEAYGRNVVNVILVDFRALDTFGEIIVLSIAAIGVWALLARPKSSKDNDS